LNLGAFLALALLAGEPVAGAAASLEAQVKSAYLFKLASFVRWPAPVGDGDPFRICIAGRSDIAGLLASFANGKQIENRPVSVMELGPAQTQQAANCRMLFLGRGAKTATALISATRDQPVLIVTDRTSGTRGGVIEFVEQNGRVRLAIDQRQAVARKLALDSELFNVAAEIER
jgi:hypothetical protein